MTELRDQLAETLHAYDCAPGSVCHACYDEAGALLPVVWAFAAQELREAAKALHREWPEVALGGATYVADFLIGRAGVMDGGERRD